MKSQVCSVVTKLGSPNSSARCLGSKRCQVSLFDDRSNYYYDSSGAFV
jgi:hypothetical protein